MSAFPRYEAAGSERERASTVVELAAMLTLGADGPPKGAPGGYVQLPGLGVLPRRSSQNRSCKLPVGDCPPFSPSMARSSAVHPLKIVPYGLEFYASDLALPG